ncbi:MAG: nucleoside-diphosphate sugar epimerase/dehydratase [Nitrososphaerota archaeon]
MKKLLFNLLKLIIDLLLFSIATYISFYLRFDGKIPITYIRMLYLTLPIEIILIILSFNFFKTSKRFWEFFSIPDLFNLIYSIIFEKSIFAFLTYIFRDNSYLQRYINSRNILYYPRSVLLTSIAISIILLTSVRIIFRIFFEEKEKLIKLNENQKIKALIIGAGKTGVHLFRELRRNNYFNYEFIGFLDDNEDKIGMYIDNIKVLGKVNELNNIVEKYNVNEIIIAIPSASSEFIRNIIQNTKGKVKFKIVQNINQVDKFNNIYSKIRPIKVEDVLGREIVEINLDEVKNFIENKTILITGAAGSIGSELAKQISVFNIKYLILLDINESGLYMLNQDIKIKNKVKIIICDIRNYNKLERIISDYKPQIIYHSAAYKHVPLMEEFKDEAISTNIFGTLNLVELANKYNTESFIFISTDKAVKPTNIMGATKRIGELIIYKYSKISKTKFMIVRFGNVFGSSGSVIPIFIQQIENGGPVTITHPEMERYFMTTSEAVKLILQASSIGSGGEIFLLDMGNPIKILDIAKTLIKIYGYEPNKDINIEFTGIRPGEKIKEELYYEFEELKRTKHPKIYVLENKMNCDFDINKLKEEPNLFLKKIMN